METLSDLWKFMRERKKYWLLPAILLLLVIGGLLIITAGSPAAPFVYTLF